MRAWLARGVATGLVAMSLAFGLVLTAGPANALVPPPPPVPTFIIGGTLSATGGAATGVGATTTTTAASTACIASIWCAAGVGVAAVGVGLYLTRDTWVPWVKGMLPEKAGATNGKGNASGLLSLSPFRQVAGPAGQVRVETTITNFSYYSEAPVGERTVICSAGDGTYSTKFDEYINITPNTVAGGSKTTVTLECGAGNVVFASLRNTPGRSGAQAPFNNSVTWAGDGIGQADKASTYRSTVDCRRPDGTTTKISAEYTGASGGFLQPSCEANGVGVGSVGTGVKVEGQTPGSTRWNPVYEVQPRVPTEYADCDPLTGGAPCRLEVWVNGQPCQVGASLCEEWIRNQVKGLGTYQCKWGPYVVPLVQCDMLERAYLPEGTQMTGPNTDGVVETYLDLHPDGSVKNKTSTDTGGDTGTVQVDPAPAPVPTTVPKTDPKARGEGCYPTGMAAWNPVEWVLQPVQCALSWAFVPSTTGVATTTAQLQGTLNDTGFAPLMSAVGATVEPLGVASGCQGPMMPFNLGEVDEELYPFSACEAPMSIAAGYTYALSTVIVVIGGGLACVRAVGTGFGFNFSTKAGDGE